jgi:hypothetical protein
MVDWSGGLLCILVLLLIYPLSNEELYFITIIILVVLEIELRALGLQSRCSTA